MHIFPLSYCWAPQYPEEVLKYKWNWIPTGPTNGGDEWGQIIRSAATICQVLMRRREIAHATSNPNWLVLTPQWIHSLGEIMKTKFQVSNGGYCPPFVRASHMLLCSHLACLFHAWSGWSFFLSLLFFFFPTCKCLFNIISKINIFDTFIWA